MANQIVTILLKIKHKFQTTFSKDKLEIKTKLLRENQKYNFLKTYYVE